MKLNRRQLRRLILKEVNLIKEGKKIKKIKKEDGEYELHLPPTSRPKGEKIKFSGSRKDKEITVKLLLWHGSGKRYEIISQSPFESENEESEKEPAINRNPGALF